ncbi:MAG: hypothetical protein RMK01_07820 [Thermomicrobium sp.]|nr:hypothetical protein [Thermomicrobium sp.]MDW8059966.1 hypothetical protein [Thermomicrobium sp.]
MADRTEVAPAPAVTFRGTEREQELAERVHALLRASARFYPLHAPIRVPLRAVAEYFATLEPTVSPEEWFAQLKRAIEANDHVFALEASDGELVVATTRGGSPPLPPEALIDTAHQLPRRFMEPPPEAVAPAPRPRKAESTAPVEEAVPEAAEETAVAEAVSTVVEDLSLLSDAELLEAVRATLSQLPGVVGFGDLWAAADIVPRFSRGDVRRIREYIAERGEPLLDDELLEVVLKVPSRSPEATLYRLALDVHLAEESDFEFVGVPDAHAWTIREINPVPTPKRRPADIGQDYRYLLEETGTVQPASESVVDHVLTFYEHYLGVLPYDATLASVLPGRVFPAQARALLQFEAAQTHETFYVELRYPTANRGGFLFGLEPFFAANLVAGALITIERTDDPRRFVIDYLPISRQERRLLALDEKQKRYEFRPTVYFCAVQDSMLLTEQRFPRFAGQQPLDERTRRAYERVLEVTFERIGENVGTPEAPRYMATLDDLVAAVNVERPLSAEKIRQILASPEFPQFEPDPEVEDLFYYTPNR